MKFCDHDFLLSTPTARRLFRKFAAAQPIIDYHCHLSAADLAGDRRFANIHEAWLEGDHYKWRAMRANGIPERLVTGKSSPREKFSAWAATVPRTLRNPLYHWAHLEMRRYFGIEKLLDARNADAIWRETGRQLGQPGYSARGLVERMRVEVICTTDDPADDLVHHRKLSASDWRVKIYPTFRPDNALRVNDPAGFKVWLKKLSETAGESADTFRGFLRVLENRHAAFHALGGRLSDHGLTRLPEGECTEKVAAAIFRSTLAGRTAGPADTERFAAHMMHFFGELDVERGWTKQLHLGAVRNPNSRLQKQLGSDAGCDTIGDYSQLATLAPYLDRLDRLGRLPKVILYNINPADTHVLAALCGSFQDGSAAGKLQYGAAWWFLDQERGIRAQLDALSDLGLLSRFVGMLTDSRSFLSFPRHEYFRRILCDAIGSDVESGRIPDREDLLRPLITDICHRNARNYFDFPA